MWRRVNGAAGLLLFGALMVLRPQPGQNAPASWTSTVFAQTRNPLGCYEAAREETALSPDAALLLCQGATGTGPVACFEAATDRTPLSDNLNVLLCQCATNTAPVECVERADDETDLTDQRILNVCSARVLGHLGPNCIQLP